MYSSSEVIMSFNWNLSAVNLKEYGLMVNKKDQKNKQIYE